MIASTMMLAVGVAAVAVGFQQLSSGFESYIGHENTISLCFFGIMLFTAGVFCPFHGTFYGFFAGFFLGSVLLAYGLS
jgi:hypothetical protein